MRLNEFERAGQGIRTRYVARIADATGAEDYELVVAGADDVIGAVLGDSDFNLEIDPNVGFDRSEEELRRDFEQQEEAFAEMARLEDPADLPMFKTPPERPSIKTSVFVSLRRVRGEGTFWGPWSFSYWLPWPFSIWVWPPPFCSVSACVQPASGDQDLYLWETIGWGWIIGGLGSSLRGGTARDCVAWSLPPLTSCNLFTHKTGVYQIYAWATGSGSFTYRGFS